jgi:hypothetical protein
MQVLKVWGLAVGLLIICILASTLQLSAALPNRSQLKALNPAALSYTQKTAHSELQQGSPVLIPTVLVACVVGQGASLDVRHKSTHKIAQCAITSSAQ